MNSEPSHFLKFLKDKGYYKKPAMAGLLVGHLQTKSNIILIRR